jgi:hypothetical protein
LCIQQYDVAKKTMMKEIVVNSNVVTLNPCTGREIKAATNHTAWPMVRNL